MGLSQALMLTFFLYFKLPLTSSRLFIFAPPLLCHVSDKLDEILAAAQHTITSDNQGQRGHGGKRDRSKSIVPNVSNEVIGRKWSDLWLIAQLRLCLICKILINTE